MADLGNIFDSLFKTPWLNLVHEGESLFSEEVKNLQADAEAKIESARASLAAAVDAHQAAVEASVSGVVDSGIKALADHLPIVGPLLAGQAEAAANDATDTVIHSLIAKLETFLSPNKAGAGSTLDEPPV